MVVLPLVVLPSFGCPGLHAPRRLPDAVVDAVRQLQGRVDALSQHHQALVEGGVEDPEKAREMIENMADQLEELYAERDRRAETYVERSGDAEAPSGNA